MFKISIKHAGVITRENNIPKIVLKGFNFYEKGSIDLLYNKKNKYAEITDWITPEEMRTTFKMTADGVRSLFIDIRFQQRLSMVVPIIPNNT